MFTPSKRKSAQITAYLNMLNELTNNAIVQKNAKNTQKMSGDTTNAAKVDGNVTTVQNSAENAVNGGFSFAKQFNKTTFDIDVTDFEYCKLATLYKADAPQTVYRVDAMWVTKSPLGDSPVFVVSEIGKLVNMPTHTANTVREIVANSAAVDAIKGGKVGFTVYEYESHGKKCYGVRFVDL